MTRLSGDVLALLTDWLPSNDEADRPQIQLATAELGGGTDSRTVLMSSWDTDGFRLHTDSRSRKSTQLAAEPRCSFVVLWPGFTRQLVVAGRAEKSDAADLASAYERRSPYLRRLAWLNSHETAQLGRDERVARWVQDEAERQDSALTAPETWTGYLIRPTRLTFWESDPDGPSHRTEFQVGETGWETLHLAG